VHPLVSPSRPRPFNPPQIRHICLKDEAVLAQDAMQGVLDSIGSVSLVLQAQEIFTIVAKENANFDLQAFSATTSLFVVCLHVKE
jgi:hypothetical protein